MKLKETVSDEASEDQYGVRSIKYIYTFIHQNGSIKRKKYIHTKIYNKQERKQK